MFGLPVEEVGEDERSGNEDEEAEDDADNGA